MHLSAEHKGERLTLRLAGEWRARELAAIRAELAAVPLGQVREIAVDAQGAARLDLSGAWLLRDFLDTATAGGVRQTGFIGEVPAQLALIERARAEEIASRGDAAAGKGEESPVAAVGRRVLAQWRGLGDGLDFLGRVTVQASRACRSLRRLRPTSVARHVYDTGITAIPIVALIAFLISVIIAYMSAQQLRNFGAEVYVVDLVTIGVLRELGVLLTAIIVAGRSGSAFAAEIGAMKLNEEVDALTATGVEPIEVLVLPRVLGLMIALPLLTIIADGVGLAGGALLCKYLLDMPIIQYFARVEDAISATTFWAGLIKAPVFALLIATAGTFRGLQVRSSSRELGRLTTVAVVQAIFLVILADALFAVLFMEIDF
jgi:phospholipid/cholesterol/gamma-HCH transport system permease protein